LNVMLILSWMYCFTSSLHPSLLSWSIATNIDAKPLW
jgi:hypothetical protein